MTIARANNSILKVISGGGGSEVKIGDSFYRTIKINGIEWICSDLLYIDNLTNAGNNPIASNIPAYWYIDGEPYTNHIFYNHSAIEFFINNDTFGNGWRVPFVEDYNKLILEFDIYKLRSHFGWYDTTGTDDIGFSMTAPGYFSESALPYFFNKSQLNNQWTQTLDGVYFKAKQFLSSMINEITEPSTQRGYSLRLCRDY